MKTLVTSLALSALLLNSAAQAQTKSPARPATKTGTTTARTTAAKPAVATATKPTAPVQATAQPAKATEAPAPKAKAKASSAGSSSAGFGKGSMAINLGVGLGLGYGYGGVFASGYRNFPALNLSVEKGISDNVGPGTISVGALVGYKGSSYKIEPYKATWTNIIVAARGAYHYNLTENPKVDTYAGISLGVRIESYKDNWGEDFGHNTSYGGAYLTSGIFLGGRYYFTDKIGAFGEFGYDMSLLKLGLTAKF